MVKGLKEPKLRFSEYRGTAGWEEVLFAEIFNSYTEKNVEGYPQYTIGVNGMKLNNEGRHDTSKHIVFKPNSMMLGIGVEEVGFSKETYGCCSPIYKIYSINDKVLDIDFAMDYIKRVFKKNRGLIARTSTRREYEFSYTDLDELGILLPSIEEQQKIGSFFSLLDQKINLQSEKIQNLTLYKKGLLQQVMSREIRFKDSEGREYPEWEKVKLGRIFDILVGGDVPKDAFSKEKTKEYNIPIFSNSLENKGLYGFTDNPRVIEKESITVTGRGDIGKAVYRNTPHYPIVRLLVCTPKEELCVKFFEYAINNIKIIPESTGVPQLTAPQLSTYTVVKPCQEEQHKIASLFSTIDKKIEKEQEKLELLQREKKAFMQQMFI